MKTLIKAVVFLPCGMWRKVSSELATLGSTSSPLLGPGWTFQRV